MGPREGDMGGQFGGQGRPDPTHALELVQRTEMAVGLAVGDDPGSQRRSDAGQSVQLLGAGPVDVHGPEGLGRRRGSGSRAARGRPPTRRHGRVHGRDLCRQRLAGVGRDLHAGKRATAAHPESERSDGRHKEQGAALGGSRHAAGCRIPPAAAASPLRVRHRKSRSTVIATSPTICRVACDSLSAVSSGVWCQA